MPSDVSGHRYELRAVLCNVTELQVRREAREAMTINAADRALRCFLVVCRFFSQLLSVALDEDTCLLEVI